MHVLRAACDSEDCSASVELHPKQRGFEFGGQVVSFSAYFGFPKGWALTISPNGAETIHCQNHVRTPK